MQLWVPIVVLSVFLACLCGCAIVRRIYRQRNAAAAVNQGETGTTGEITAEQLAGTLRGHTATARRGRRTRRTPSQISVLSLPAYSKDANDNELVIYRADETEVDVAPATTIHMSSAAIPEYTTAPESPQTMHLLQDDVLQVPPNPPIPPGMPTPSPSWIYPPSSEPSPSPTDPGIVNVPDASPRRSTFMGLFSPRSRDTSTPQGGGHRPSHSASGSLLSMNLPRKKSTATLNSTRNLTSPSSLSVNSISAPLTHTLVRTEFGYPKSGPTPEQLRLISSRESIARFGRPYGPDAIAFAASTSRQELPPDFEQVELAQTPVHVVRGSPEPLEFSSGLDFATSAADQGSEGRHLATSAERSPTLPQHSRLAASTSRPLSGASSSTSESAGAYATADESSTMHETDDPDPLRQ